MSSRRDFLKLSALGTASFAVPGAYSSELTMTYNTGNPVPSKDARDLTDNAESLDIRMTSRVVRSTPDRLGIPRKTWHGIEQDFAEFLAASGFEPDHLTYQSGVALQVDRPTQLIDYDGSVYRVKMPASFPVMLSGVWSDDSAGLVDVGDHSLRSELASPDKGAGMVAYKESASVKEYLDSLSVDAVPSKGSSPVLVEQMITGFFGRGMLEAEQQYINTEQNFTAAAAKGDFVVNVADSNGYEVGGNAVIAYPSGKYKPHFIAAKTATTLTVRPGLYEDVTASDAIARTWWDQAHPGRFYTRYLAQRVAHCTELEAMPQVRNYFSQYDSNPATGADVLVAYGSAVVQYYDATNDGGGGLISSPVERIIGRTAFITTNAENSGGETRFFPVRAGEMQARLIMAIENGSSIVTVSAVDESGRVIEAHKIQPDYRNMQKIYDFVFKVNGTSKTAKLRITSIAASDRLKIDQLEVFPRNELSGSVIGQLPCTIVALGDSWVAGYLEGSPQREPLTMQLQKELPNATIINAGIGGNRVWDMLARFDTDVAPHNPDFVVVNTGTNDAANPASTVFYPNAVDYFNSKYCELIGRIISIGARPILISVPALSEVRGLATDWILNDRARLYWQHFVKMFSALDDDTAEAVKVHSRGGSDQQGYIAYTDGTLKFWRMVNVNMTIDTPQEFTAPGIPSVGRVRAGITPLTFGSGTSAAAWASTVMRWQGAWIVNVTSVGTSTSDPAMLTGEGFWK